MVSSPAIINIRPISTGPSSSCFRPRVLRKAISPSSYHHQHDAREASSTASSWVWQYDGSSLPLSIMKTKWLHVLLLVKVLLLLLAFTTPVTAVARTSVSACTSSFPPQNCHIMLVSLSLRGHIIPLSRLALELSQRGHRVSFAAQDDGRDFVNKTGSKFVSLGRLSMSPNERRDKLRQISHDMSFFRGMLTLFNDIYLPYSQPYYKALTSVVNKDRPDIMVIDIGALGAVDVAHANNIPYVINNPSLLFRIDNNPHYVPAWGSGFTQQMTLWERCLSVLYPRLLAVALTPTFMDLNKLRYNRGLPLYRSQGEIFDNALMIANTAFGFEYPLPVTPLTKLVGPLMPSVKPPIPASLSAWLDKSSKPVVLVLFGFGCMSYLEGWQVRQLYNGLNESKFRVLWALRPEEKVLLQKVGDVQFPATTFRIKSNFPQLGVIAHTSVRVVVSPCGMATAQESLYYGKTLLCIPMMGDQVDVAARVVDSGAGMMLDKTRLDANDITTAIKKLFTNSTMRYAAKRIGKVLRAAGGTSSAADFVEGALAPGVEHLHARHQSLPWHQQQQLDVLAVVIAIICILMLMVRTAIITAFYLYYRAVKVGRRLFPSLCPTPPPGFVNGPNGGAIDGACWYGFIHRCRCYCGTRSWPCLPTPVLTCISICCNRIASVCCYGTCGRLTSICCCCCPRARADVAAYMTDWPRGDDYRLDKRWLLAHGNDGMNGGSAAANGGIVMGPPGSNAVPPPFRFGSGASSSSSSNGHHYGTNHYSNGDHTSGSGANGNGSNGGGVGSDDSALDHMEPIVPNTESKRAATFIGHNDELASHHRGSGGAAVVSSTDEHED